MTIEEKIERLTENQIIALDSIRALERVALAHQTMIEEQSEQIQTLTQRTSEAINSLADQMHDLTRQWQAYITRLPRT